MIDLQGVYIEQYVRGRRFIRSDELYSSGTSPIESESPHNVVNDAHQRASACTDTKNQRVSRWRGRDL